LLVERGVVLDLKFSAAMRTVDEVSAFFEADGSLKEGAGAGFRPGRRDRAEPLLEQVLLNEALSYACHAGRHDTATFLLKKGAQVDAITPPLSGGDGGSTALHKAAWADEIKIVRFLLEQGADPTVTDDRHDLTASRWAAYRGYDEIVKTLETAEANWGKP
jgi:ankyrin repeat protein